MDFVQPMMELLKLLGTLGAYSLAVAITAIVGILVFKLTQLVSILLLIRYGILRFFDWMTMRKTTIVETTTELVEKVTAFTLNGHIITHTSEGNVDRFMELLNRLKRISAYSGIKPMEESKYLHESHLDYLEEAIKNIEDKYRDRGLQ
jgi:hypothetical protein